MASVDGRKSIQASSDQLFDHVCGSCKTEGKENEARKYCEDCAEYVCDSCVNVHRKFPLMKTHKIVSARAAPIRASGSRLTVYCACNKNKEVEFFCEDHSDIICGPCQSFKHHKCNTPSIQQKSSGYTSAKLDLILAKTKSLQDAYDRLEKECKENEAELERSKEACKEEIKTFRKQLDDFLDKLEENMLATLDQYASKENHRMHQHIETLTTALRMLDTEHTLLDKARQDGRKESMFSVDTQVSTNLRDFQSRLDDLEKYVSNVRLSFERNTALDGLQKDVKAFGTLKLSAKEVKMSKKTVLLGRQIQLRRKVNVRLADDENDPFITGCIFMSNGYLVACDYNNNNIKLLDSSLSLQDSLKLPTHPRDVSVIDDNTVIVTMPGRKQLQYVQVFPQLRTSHVIQLDKECWGVKVSGQNIYVSCYSFLDNDGEVRVLDKQGNLQRRLGIRDDGSYLFSTPYNITVSTAGDKIYVSDGCDPHSNLYES